MELLSATPQDALRLAELNEKMIEASGHCTGLDRVGLFHRMQNWLTAKEYHAHFIINEGTFIGYSLSKSDTTPAILRQFYIEPEYRRKGFGTLAVQLLLKEYLGRAHIIQLDVHPTNETAMAFWRSNGFHGTPEKMQYIRARGI